MRLSSNLMKLCIVFAGSSRRCASANFVKDFASFSRISDDHVIDVDHDVGVICALTFASDRRRLKPSSAGQAAK